MNFRRAATFGLLLALGLAARTLADTAAELEPLPLKLPKPRYYPTPPNIGKPRLDPCDKGKRRPPFYAPKGISNVALHRSVTSSDPKPEIGTLDQITDGDNQPREESIVQLADGRQWIQIDLSTRHEIWAIVVWHQDATAYRDVIVQTSDDPDFKRNVTTIFNNDQSNELHLGAGRDFEYIENYEGKLVDGQRTKSRYVRLYSNGSTQNRANQYGEVEVYAMPIK